MYRWLGLGVVVVAMILAACGRQVTGLGVTGSSSIESGHMLIQFNVAGPLDFTDYQYVIVFNTSGNGVEPYPQGFLTGYKNYSFAFIVGGTSYTTLPILDQYYIAPGTTTPQGIRVVIPTQDINYIPNSGENPSGGGQFQITFDRSLLYGVNPGGISPSPSPDGSPVPSPTTVPTGATSAPTLNPNVQPTTAAQETWYINFITTDINGNPIDSMGLNGPTDTTFTYSINTTTSVDYNYTKPVGNTVPQNQSSQIQGFEIINQP